MTVVEGSPTDGGVTEGGTIRFLFERTGGDLNSAFDFEWAYNPPLPLGAATQTAPAIPFAISGVPIARDALLAEAGLDLAIGRSATVGVSYTGQIARYVHDHAAKGKFSWRF
jgi:uncharacterized protein with beta-barrel porin domain